MATYNMSDHIVWAPRTIRRDPEVALTAASNNSDATLLKKMQRQWDHLVTALMRTLDDFQDAKAAVMKKFIEIEDVEEIPEWGT